MANEKKPKILYRCEKHKKLFGVCAGFAEYFDLDPTLVRIAWILISLVYGFGIVTYVLTFILMPVNPSKEHL